MTCETVGKLLLDYVEGELPPRQAKSVQAHLDECLACAAKYRETRALLGDLSAARCADQEAWESGASQPPPAQPAALQERAVIGDFEILGELGRGGMGVVYRARQISLNRVVALKVLSTATVQSERSISRFAREAQAAARLHHTNIVPIYAQGREQGYFYYAMELIEGESLDKVLRRQRESIADQSSAEGGPGLGLRTTRRLTSPIKLLRSAASTVRLSRTPRGEQLPHDYKRCARLIAAVAEGLHHAHEEGVVHRDIKPQNLMLGRDDELHITDFGLARLLDEPGLTLSTELVGTPAYMAPEQIAGTGQSVDRRTDVYSLGVTLYELLTLRQPFRGESYQQTINQVLSREPKPPRRIDPRIPADLETICLRAMEKEPQRRFPTAADLARDLRRYAEGFPIVSRPIGPIGKAVRWIRRHPARASAVAASALLAIVVPLALSFFNATADAQIDRALGVLLNDYRQKDHALAELGWSSHLGGDRQRYDLVQAFAHIRTKPERSIGILKRALADHPNDPDAHYLLAWAYARRTQTQGVEMWADTQRHITLADDLAPEPERSAEGCFFRGQAVWGIDPREAERSFELAIAKRSNFTQAMLHQGRAMNQIMYSVRDISYYQRAVGRLEYVALSQPDKAYPRYLLSLAHLMAAETYAAQLAAAADPNEGAKLARQRDEAYADSLEAARDAQKVDPKSPRGYAAEANYYESLGQMGPTIDTEKFHEAIDTWNRFGDQSIRKSDSDRSERFAYQMRLHFWLGQYAEAEKMRKGRYGEQSGYDRERLYDADETFYEALIAASAGDLARAERALAEGVELARGRPEQLLRLDAAYRLVGRPPPAELLTDHIPSGCKLSPGWTPDWLAVLVRHQRDARDWEAVEVAASAGIQRRDDLRLRMAGAYFFRGVRELAAGRREEAIEAFEAARDQYDNENYCFRAKFLWIKLRDDPLWPAWSAAGKARAP